MESERATLSLRLSVASDCLYGKRSFSVTTPCASPTREDIERLAERETLLHRLGSKLNRTVFNSCGNSLSVAEKHVTFAQPGFFANRVIFTELTIFGNTKQVIQDYDTVFDNSIPFRKNDPLRILQWRSEWTSETMRNRVQSFRSFSLELIYLC